MLTVPFKRVYQGVLSMTEKPATTTLTAAETEEFITWINNRVREAWQYAFWPETIMVDYRAYREGYRIDVSYEARREVWDESSEKYYRSMQASNLAHALTETTWWEEITTLDTYLPQFPLDSYPIGTLIGLTAEHPYTAAERYRSYAFRVANQGYWLTQSAAPLKVWAEFRMAPNQFTLTEYSASTTYQPADIVYMPSIGECYQAVYVDDVQGWNKIDFPAFMETFVKLAAASDYHRNYGRGGTYADSVLGQAYQFLENERNYQCEQQSQYLTSVGAPLR